ncbi:MAG: DUF5777 family beta-barrel protein [Cyclobacteriaceae bacterium]
MRKISLIIGLMVSLSASAQDELLELLEGDSDDKQYVYATFKSTRLVNGQSVEMRTRGVLEFIIGHRFGRINQGGSELWGLDQSSIRLGLEYGLTDNLNIGLGRASFGKVYDGFLKYRAIRQSNSSPMTVTLFGSTARESIPEGGLEGADRYAHTIQILVARKFNSNVSLQLMPTVIQRNSVPTFQDDNLLMALGMGGRYKVSNRVAILAEYYPQLTDFNESLTNSFAIGVDIETGGHVFQLHLTNAEQMNERGFIGETRDDFFDGDIHFGFNISRVFDLKPGN